MKHLKITQQRLNIIIQGFFSDSSGILKHILLQNVDRLISRARFRGGRHTKQNSMNTAYDIIIYLIGDQCLIVQAKITENTEVYF